MSELQTEAVMASPLEESNAAKQARLRRERREAKIKAGGSARLEKITNLSGRPIEPGMKLDCPLVLRRCQAYTNKMKLKLHQLLTLSLPTRAPRGLFLPMTQKR